MRCLLTRAEMLQLIARLRNRADYWRRKVRKPGYESGRKARWRRDNLEKYAAELKKNVQRAHTKRHGDVSINN